jgi:hypothetical protein
MSKLFKSKKPPAPEPEPVAPIPDEELDQVAQERDYQRRYGGRGRVGTVLSAGGKLGGMGRRTATAGGGGGSSSRGKPSPAAVRNIQNLTAGIYR